MLNRSDMVGSKIHKNADLKRNSVRSVHFKPERRGFDNAIFAACVNHSSEKLLKFIAFGRCVLRFFVNITERSTVRSDNSALFSRSLNKASCDVRRRCFALRSRYSDNLKLIARATEIIYRGKCQGMTCIFRNYLNAVLGKLKLMLGKNASASAVISTHGILVSVRQGSCQAKEAFTLACFSRIVCNVFYIKIGKIIT